MKLRKIGDVWKALGKIFHLSGCGGSNGLEVTNLVIFATLTGLEVTILERKTSLSQVKINQSLKSWRDNESPSNLQDVYKTASL